MSWNGSIPRKSKKVSGLRNKRNKKSPNAIQSRMNRLAKREAERPTRFEKRDDQMDY